MSKNGWRVTGLAGKWEVAKKSSRGGCGPADARHGFGLAAAPVCGEKDANPSRLRVASPVAYEQSKSGYVSSKQQWRISVSAQ